MSERELNEYRQLLRDAYRGEVLGAAFFGTLAARQPDPERREKLERFVELELAEAGAKSLKPLQDHLRRPA